MRRLVCLLPQIRNYEQTWRKFKENVLDVLDADLLLCVGTAQARTAGRVIDGVEASEDNEYFKNAKYIFRHPDPDDWSEAYDEMSSEWRNFAHIPDGWLGPARLPTPHTNAGGIILFFRWFLYKNLLENDLLSKYDQIIVSRSDFYWIKPHPILDNDHVWFPNGQFHGGLCDRHMVVPSKWAGDFLGIGGTISREQYEPMVKFFMERPWGHRWMYNIETYLWFRYLLAGIHTRIGFFQQKMVLASLPQNSAKESYNPKYGIHVRYQAELDDCESPDRDNIVWPFEIEHTYISYDMFTGRVHAKNQ